MRRARCRQQTPAWVAKQLPGKDGEEQVAPKQGNSHRFCSLLFHKGLYPSCAWGLQPATAWTGPPQHPWVLPPNMVTPIPLPRAHLPSQALPYRSSLIFFHTITLSSIDAIILLHAPPACLLLPPWVREFFGPRAQVFSRRQEMHHVPGTVGEYHPAPRPLPSTQTGKKPQKSQKKPNQPPVSAMHPGFLYIDCVI